MHRHNKNNRTHKRETEKAKVTVETETTVSPNPLLQAAMGMLGGNAELMKAMEETRKQAQLKFLREFMEDEGKLLVMEWLKPFFDEIDARLDGLEVHTGVDVVESEGSDDAYKTQSESDSDSA